MTTADEFDVLILGGGLAGLSLAWRLTDGDFGGTIGIIEPREAYRRDRTWCFWSDGRIDADVPAAARDAVAWRWPAWRVVGRGGGEVRRSRPGLAYCGLPADGFYGAVLPRLEVDPRVAWWRGWSAGDVDEAAGEVEVVAPGDGRRTLRAGLIVDTRPPGTYRVGDVAAGPAPSFGDRPAIEARSRPRGYGTQVALVQQFVGVEFKCGDGVAVDAGCATLMDFAATAGLPPVPGVDFLYVLPHGEGRALVEWTGMLRGTIPHDEAKARLDAAAAAALPGWRPVVGGHCESGVLPMTTASDARQPGGRVVRLGVAGGACRPSTGYAFLQIQRQARAVAGQLSRRRSASAGSRGPWSARREPNDDRCADQGPRLPAESTNPESVTVPRRSIRTRYLDSVFLRRLRRRPGDFPAIFRDLFARVRPDRLARFLADVPTPADDLAVIKAMPKLPFAAEAVRGWLASGDGWGTHRKLAVLVTLALAAGIGLLGDVPVAAQAVVLVLAASVGMAHGATDVWLGRDLFGDEGRGRTTFGGGYLLLTAAALTFSIVAPSLWLAGFLTLAWLHFGFGELPGLLPRSIPQAAASALRGAMPVALPAVLHRDGVTWALSALVEPAAASAFAGALSLLAVPTLLGVGLLISLLARRRSWWPAAEVATLAGLLLVAPPLLGFAVYFAVWHSVRHLLSDVVGASTPGRQWRPVAVSTAFPIAGAALAWLVLAGRPEAGVAASSSAVRVVFVTLGCLTVPHMALVALAASRPTREVTGVSAWSSRTTSSTPRGRTSSSSTS